MVGKQSRKIKTLKNVQTAEDQTMNYGLVMQNSYNPSQTCWARGIQSLHLQLYNVSPHAYYYNLYYILYQLIQRFGGGWTASIGSPAHRSARPDGSVKSILQHPFIIAGCHSNHSLQVCK